jgi:cyclic pyranopterin phosphate synthase
MASGGELLDRYGRRHDTLRVSVTDRCNLRCFYCMPERGVRFVGRREILSFEEIERLVRVAAGLGVRKVRVTGGEPLIRQDLPRLIRQLVSIRDLEDVALTTNGTLLAELAAPLYQAGLRRLNVHLDTLDRARFERITRRQGLERVLAGLAAAQRLGFNPVKINVVAVKDLVEPDLAPLARFGRERGFQIRFIEFMPLDAQGLWDRDKVLSAEEILETLEREIAPLVERPAAQTGAPAREFRFADGVGQVGFIASESRPFCGACNRLRLTADGKLRYCLFALQETDVKSLLRGGASDAELVAAIRSTVQAKWEGHTINGARFVAPPRAMHAIGG